MSETASQRFRRTREDHKTENAEDYVEMVQALIAETGEARVGKLAERLGVSQVTVSKTVRRLAKEGFVLAKPYSAIVLTPMGSAVAESARQRHEIVVKFLLSIGVPSATAETDAEGIEHHVSPVTLEAMKRMLDVS